ncbi:hypothetical protein [Streptomyces sp. NPDC008139]|uniref:hypothetical protein n=1 Tax=Streptomyces sp. NPDC008139 TaxID=3364814 RepID=UPI0036E82787
MASQIAAEAVLGGADSVSITIDDEWIVVEADVDWLAGVEGDPFTHLTVFPAGGPTDTTREILAVTFSSGVVTATEAGALIIKGDTAGPVRAGSVRGRLVAFKVEVDAD